MGLKFEVELVSVTKQSVGRPGEAVAVDLVSMAQPGLDDAVAALDLVDQTMEVRHEIVVDVLDMARDHRSQEHSAEPRCRIDREHERAESEASRRRTRPRVPDLEFGEQHPVGGLSVRRTAERVSEALGPYR